MSQSPFQPPACTEKQTAHASPIPPSSNFLVGCSIIACGMPMIHFLYVLLFWLYACGSLGEIAIPGAHDPKSFLFGIPHLLSQLMMLASFAVLPFVVLLGRIHHHIGSHVLSYAVCLALSITLFRVNFFQITTWIAD